MGQRVVVAIKDAYERNIIISEIMSRTYAS